MRVTGAGAGPPVGFLAPVLLGRADTGPVRLRNALASSSGRDRLVNVHSSKAFLLICVFLAGCSPPPYAVLEVRDPDGFAAEADRLVIGRSGREGAEATLANQPLPVTLTLTSEETGDALLAIDAYRGELLVAQGSAEASFSRDEQAAVLALLVATCRPDVPPGSRCLLEPSVTGICTQRGCSESICGDGFVDPTREECDDGDRDDGDECDNRCERKRSIAVLDNLPANPSNVTELAVTVRGEGVAEYRYVLLEEALSCAGAAYSGWIDVALPIEATIGGDGEKLLCVLGRDNDQLEQRDPTLYSWTFDATPPLLSIAPPDISSGPSQTQLSGTCEAPFEVLVAGSGVPELSTALCAGGTFTTRVALTPGDGLKALQVSQFDAAGNLGSTTGVALVDTAPPTPAGAALSFEIHPDSPSEALLTWASPARDDGSGVSSQVVELFSGVDPNCEGTADARLNVATDATSATWSRLDGGLGPLVRFHVVSEDGEGRRSASPCSGSVVLRNGTVTVPAPENGMAVGEPALRIDLNLDGALDLVFSDPNWGNDSGYVYAVLSGNLVTPATLFYAGFDQQRFGGLLYAMDFSGDGHDDLVVVSRPAPDVSGPGAPEPLGTVSYLAATADGLPSSGFSSDFMDFASSRTIDVTPDGASRKHWTLQHEDGQARGLLFLELSSDCLFSPPCSTLLWVDPIDPLPSEFFATQYALRGDPVLFDLRADGQPQVLFAGGDRFGGMLDVLCRLDRQTSLLSCDQAFNLQAGSMGLRLVDIESDGTAELIVLGNEEGGSGHVWIVQSDAARFDVLSPPLLHLSSSGPYPWDGFTENLRFVDISCDGTKDLISVGRNNTTNQDALFLARLEEPLMFGPGGTWPITEIDMQMDMVSKVAFYDVSGDGCADLVSTDEMDGTTRTGRFWVLSDEATDDFFIGSVGSGTAYDSHSPGRHALHDFNRDGTWSLLRFDDSSWIRGGEGPQVFGDPFWVPFLETATAVGYEDLSGDGQDELVTCAESIGGVQVVSHTFGSAQVFSTAERMVELCPANGRRFDTDGDGTREWLAGFTADPANPAARDFLSVYGSATLDGNVFSTEYTVVRSGIADAELEALSQVDTTGQGDARVLVGTGASSVTSVLYFLVGGELVPVASSAWSTEERWSGLGAYAWDADADGVLDLVLPGANEFYSPACDCFVRTALNLGENMGNGGLVVLPSRFLP